MIQSKHMNDKRGIISSKSLYYDLASIKQKRPVIHNITNFVVMSTTANMLLAIGASPIMAHASNELADIMKIAHALVINIGTLDDKWLKAIMLAQKIARDCHIPVIFDPVGAGASYYRTKAAKDIASTGVKLIRANSSEIMALAGVSANTKGVDSYHESHCAVNAAKTLAQKYQCVVVISGKSDFIINQNTIITTCHGSKYFTQVTGMGCSATAIIAAFLAVNHNDLQAATHAVLALTIAGEMAATTAKGPGSFHLTLLDALANLPQLKQSDLQFTIQSY